MDQADNTRHLDDGDVSYTLRYQATEGGFYFLDEDKPSIPDGKATVYLFRNNGDFEAGVYDKYVNAATGRPSYSNGIPLDVPKASTEFERVRTMACLIASHMSGVEDGWIRAPIEPIRIEGQYFQKLNCL